MHLGPDDPQAGAQTGHRMPVLKGLASVLDSGFCLAVADREAVATAPDASREEQYQVFVDGKARFAPRVSKIASGRVPVEAWWIRRRQGCGV